MTTKLTKTKIKEIADMIKSEFNPTKRTGAGHIAYCRVKVTELDDMIVKYKSGKLALLEPVRYNALDLNVLSKSDLQSVIDNWENIQSLFTELNK